MDATAACSLLFYIVHNYQYYVMQCPPDNTTISFLALIDAALPKIQSVVCVMLFCASNHFSVNTMNCSCP